VFRGTTLAGSATSTTFTDSGRAASTSYTYTVVAQDASGKQSAASASVSATTTGVTPDFSLTATPGSVTVQRGATAGTEINIVPTGGFAAGVFLTTSGLPSGVTTQILAPPVPGVTGTLVFTASSTAATGTFTVTVTGTSGTLTRTTTVTLTVTAPGTGNGTVNVTPAVTSNSPHFVEEQLRIANTAPITALSVTVVVQRTTGISASGQYNTVGSTITQGNSSTATAITYQFSLAAGQTLGPSTNRAFAVQMSGTGTAHPTSGDTYTVTYTTGGETFTVTGTF
jgi:hypothetical protein